VALIASLPLLVLVQTSAVSARGSAAGGGPQRVACLQPPQNLNPAVLSDAELQAYGLPTHAMIAESPQFWARALTHTKTRICDPAPAQHQHTPHHKRVMNGWSCPTPIQPHENCQNPNWAGYEAIQNLQRGVFRSAHVEFYVPTISLSMPNPTPWVSL